MFAQILIVMVLATAVTIVAHRRGAQPSLLLVLVGLVASFVPGLNRLELEPHIILNVVLPPLLFSAATEFSYFSFKQRLRSILNLGVMLVAVTAGAVGLAATWIYPEMSLIVALVLGAVISPPDAVTAVAVGRSAGLPTKIMTVLKGESLINDAAALTLFTFATATVASTHLFTSNLLVFFAYGAGVGVATGLGMAVLVHWTRSKLYNATLSTVLSVLVPFTAYMLAEEIHASGVLAVVAAGLYLGHTSSHELPTARNQERQFWLTADALLETFVFAYIGLQLRFVIEDASKSDLTLPWLAALTATTLAVVILIRMVWIYSSASLLRMVQGITGKRFYDADPFGARENFIIGWTGMRGVVTLAAAAGIPLSVLDGSAFPNRDAIQAVAFLVTIGTLLVQGISLPYIIRIFGLTSRTEEARAKQQTAKLMEIARQAGIDAIGKFRRLHDSEDVGTYADLVLKRITSSRDVDAELSVDPSLRYRLVEQILLARRSAVIRARDDRAIDDEIVREVLRQFDAEQMALDGWSAFRAPESEK
ncbi:Na+/H+ antiporter [Devosia submarina]|uniref:Na+/H+ antiporter n=1 Tax=Devosia submarina TaxID=1173082 RepID=UPI000D3BA5A8|nr:Na+/H+ antiporter [Devosia submarina]